MENRKPTLEEATATIKEYTQPNGLITHVRNGGDDSTGNGLLYTSIYLILARRAINDPSAFISNILNELLAIAKSEVVGYPGLFHRSPTKTDEPNAHDDLIGLSALTPHLLHRINYHGLHHNWCYNNTNPLKFNIKQWVSRMPHVKGFLSRNPSVFQQLCAAVVYYTHDFKSGSGTNLLWLMAQNQYHGKANKILLASMERFNTRLKARGGIKANFKTYFGGDHPITLLAEYLEA
jgi:hypothetical protein